MSSQPLRMVKGVPRERDAQLAEALPDVGLVEVAPERLPVLRIGGDADVEAQALHAADVVLAGGAATALPRDHLLERSVGREPERQPARHAGAAHETVDRPGRLPEREVGGAGEAARSGCDRERGNPLDHFFDGGRPEERSAPVARREVVGREQADEPVTSTSASLETAERIADAGEAEETARGFRRRLHVRPHASGEERAHLVDQVQRAKTPPHLLGEPPVERSHVAAACFQAACPFARSAGPPAPVAKGIG